MEILSQDQFDQQVLGLVNAERWKVGLDSLTLVESLDISSDQYAQRIAIGDFFDHTDPSNGSKPWDRAEASGYNNWSTVGENLAAGYSTPETVVDGWMSSPGHRANILNPSFTHTGIGYHYLANDIGQSNFNRYWVQMFGSEKPKPNESAIAPEQPLIAPSETNNLLLPGTRDADVLVGGDGQDKMRGLRGNDLLLGNNGDDSLFGGSGDDQLFGDVGHDRLIGGSGNDQLFGDSGHDRLVGGSGRDRLLGASVALEAGNEIDFLIGGSGADIFYLGTAKGQLYDDGQNNTLGANNYAFIKDLNVGQGDQIILNGKIADYHLGATPKGVRRGTALFLQTSGEDELIAVIRGKTGTLSLTASTFVFQQ